MANKISDWLTKQASKKKWYNFYFIISLFSLISFIVAFGLWVYIVTKNNTNLDNSGMSLIILVPPVIVTLILLLAASLARFYYNKKNIKIDNTIFVIIGQLVIPVAVFGLLCVIFILDL